MQIWIELRATNIPHLKSSVWALTPALALRTWLRTGFSLRIWQQKYETHYGMFGKSTFISHKQKSWLRNMNKNATFIHFHPFDEFWQFSWCESCLTRKWWVGLWKSLGLSPKQCKVWSNENMTLLRAILCTAEGNRSVLE